MNLKFKPFITGILFIIGIFQIELSFSQKSFQNLNPQFKWNENISLNPKAFTFLVVGDWGRNGEFHQRETAEQMEIFASKFEIKFVVSTGDNIYDNGVKSIDDALWKTSFEDIYTGAHLQVPWYCVLGNHDYKGLVDAEIKYSGVSRRWNMPGRYFAKTLKINDKDSVLLVFTDTSPFISGYHHQNGKYGDIDLQDTASQLNWINNTLSNSKAKWKMVFGHHPVYSAGTKHGSSPDLENTLNPILLKNKVQFYICGHEHDLQHLSSPNSPIDYIVSGAGSQTRETGFIEGLSKFSDGNSGFALVSVYENRTNVYFINYAGKVIYGMEKKL